MTNTRLHREVLKQQLMNYDYSNTPVDKSILVELDEPQITVSTEGPDGFTHWRASGGELGKLIDMMINKPKADFFEIVENIAMYLGFLCIISLILINLFNV